MKRTSVAILIIACVAATVLSMIFVSTLTLAASPRSFMQIAAPPSSTPIEVTTLLASPWNTTACADIDSGLWRGRLVDRDWAMLPDRLLQEGNDPMVHSVPDGVVVVRP